jgi:hypothetical protein
MFSDTVCCINPKMGVSHKRGMVHKCEIIDQRNSCHFQSQLFGLASRPWHASAHVMRGQFNPCRAARLFYFLVLFAKDFHK